MPSNKISITWRAFQLFQQGLDTQQIAHHLAAEYPNAKIDEARVYNALAKARDELYDGGLSWPTEQQHPDVVTVKPNLQEKAGAA